MLSQSLNEVIDILGTEVRRMIINKMNAAGMLGISADTTPNPSRYDQMTVVARYVKDMTPYKRFLSLKHGKSKTGEDTAKDIISVILKNQLDTNNIVPQS
ncbi:unnamed protein product [Lepeophtheirus salmonis]|uniref:(salmon louse) hypothetical protein n=1 Tax=Lepeophtheirus salmonis TaxID=72036 RepID=A0A7R8CEI5_LEPSM|nr:unnamed protein product [Lepeophtheirus salmonis]CAF2796479.1 unnamed protein product [Lepeophtheirus salmonis]